MSAHFAHLDRVCDPIEKTDGLLIRPAFLIRVALPSDREKIHGRNLNDLRFPGRQIKLLILLFIIKCHSSLLQKDS